MFKSGLERLFNENKDQIYALGKEPMYAKNREDLGRIRSAISRSCADSEPDPNKKYTFLVEQIGLTFYTGNGAESETLVANIGGERDKAICVEGTKDFSFNLTPIIGAMQAKAVAKKHRVQFTDRNYGLGETDLRRRVFADKISAGTDVIRAYRSVLAAQNEFEKHNK